MKEIWKDIPEYEGVYQISNLGNIRSLDRTIKDKNKTYLLHGKTLKQGLRNSYKVINLNKNATRKSYQIHRLVAEAFIPNPNNYNIVNHIDENPTNNNVNNLEWCNQKHNVNHSKYKMCHPRNTKLSTKTNEKYINIKNNKYRVGIRQIKVDVCFDNLYDATLYRDEMLPVLEEYYENSKNG